MNDPVMTDLSRHLGEIDKQDAAAARVEARQDAVYEEILSGRAHDFATHVLGRGSLDTDELLSLLQVLLLGQRAGDEAERMRNWLDAEVTAFVGGK